MQDFEMPTVSTCMKISPDNEYLLVTGTYKPRVKCYEFHNLSAKFDRCFDADVTAFDFVSEDYKQLAFLQVDRHIELHQGGGKHYRFRVPRFGRDIKYNRRTDDLLVVGSGNEINRINLCKGGFVDSYEAEGTALNVCELNYANSLFFTGSEEGVIESWDYRQGKKLFSLNVASALSNTKIFPSVTSIKMIKDDFNMAVGTESGHVLLYDIRCYTPRLIKDHLNQFPVTKLAYNSSNHAVYSMDSGILKIWDDNSVSFFLI